jgi:hypothetical protein
MMQTWGDSMRRGVGGCIRTVGAKKAKKAKKTKKQKEKHQVCLT